MDVGSGTAASAAAATPPAAMTTYDPGPAAQLPPAGLPAQPHEATLQQTVANVFGGGSAQRNVEVNLRVAQHPDEIIAVFRDATTGEVISQVPTETIVHLAEFFEQEAAGALLDRNA